MALENDNGMVMPVMPTGFGGGYGNGFGDNGWWIILLFILLGGWGGGYGYGGGNGAMFVDSGVQRGFDQSAVMGAINGVGNNVVGGFSDTATNLCGGFAGVTAAINNGFAQAEIAANARAMNDMQNIFSLQSQLAQCCCDNRLATCQTQNIVQNEGSSTRLAIQNQTQSILDKICSLEIEAKNDKIDDLERQLSMAALQASQVAQTAEIISKLPAATTGA